MCSALLFDKQKNQYKQILQKFQEKFWKNFEIFYSETINSNLELGFHAAGSLVFYRREAELRTACGTTSIGFKQQDTKKLLKRLRWV